MKRERVNEPRALDSQNVCTLKFTSSLVTARLDLRGISTAIPLNPLLLKGGIQGPGGIAQTCAWTWNMFSEKLFQCSSQQPVGFILPAMLSQVCINSVTPLYPHPVEYSSPTLLSMVFQGSGPPRAGPFPFVEPTTSPRKDHNASMSHLMGHVFTTFENNIQEVAVQVSL